jgi:hypothetical protein
VDNQSKVSSSEDECYSAWPVSDPVVSMLCLLGVAFLTAETCCNNKNMRRKDAKSGNNHATIRIFMKVALIRLESNN